MFVVLIRTVVLYLFIIAGIRLLGKHQIGELEPSELEIGRASCRERVSASV